MEEKAVNHFDEIIKMSFDSITIKEAYDFLGIKVLVRNKKNPIVKPTDFTVDASYHRPLDKGTVESIINDFNIKAIGEITISVRENGDLYIIDGAHRIAALIHLGMGEHEVRTNALYDLSIEEESKLYKLLNNIQ